MRESVSRIKNGMALERSFSSSGLAADGALAAGEYRIARELMDTLSADAGTPRSVRRALEKKALEVQRRLDTLEVKLPSDSRAQAQVMAAAARAERRQAAGKVAAAAVQLQAVVRGRQARAATAPMRAERNRQQAAATRIQARRRANLVRAEMRAKSAEADEQVELEHYANSGMTDTDDELDDDIMEMLMSPRMNDELSGPPLPPPPPQVYAEQLADLRHRLQELEAQPLISPVDAPVVAASVTACVHSIQLLLHRAMQVVASTTSLQVEQIALDYIARCFVAGEILPLEPEAEPAPFEHVVEEWSADRTLSAFLCALEAKVASAISMAMFEHLQADEHLQLMSSAQSDRQLCERTGQQLLVLASNTFGGQTLSSPTVSLPLSASAAEPGGEVEAEAAGIQTDVSHLAALRNELAELRLSVLRKRAESLVADEKMVDEAEDNDDPREALISLIVSASS